MRHRSGQQALPPDPRGRDPTHRVAAAPYAGPADCFGAPSVEPDPAEPAHHGGITVVEVDVALDHEAMLLLDMTAARTETFDDVARFGRSSD
ncbi:hypothetical protein GCM10023335_42220 [Streptomyces siamensis]|uniref:Uncharacterized protein n=1 Tax=Streptomyces siamensis TaxID=1274986 RepID=A0ABP9J266_9ACTN